MSIQFSDTSTLKGLIQLIELRLGFPSTYISGDTTRLKQFTALINMALDDYTELAIKSSGKFQWDDSNQTDYPIITTNLVSGQRSYSFTTDGSSNLILFLYRAAILPSATATLYQEIFPIDVQSDLENDILRNVTSGGVPYQYDKTANGIFLDPIPNYNATNGLKLWINREGSYFTTADTTKKPGTPGVHHEYFVTKPCFWYAKANNLTSLPQLEKEVVDWEGSERLGVMGRIQEYFSIRSKDERVVISGEFNEYE